LEPLRGGNENQRSLEGKLTSEIKKRGEEKGELGTIFLPRGADMRWKRGRAMRERQRHQKEESG